MKPTIKKPTPANPRQYAEIIQTIHSRNHTTGAVRYTIALCMLGIA